MYRAREYLEQSQADLWRVLASQGGHRGKNLELSNHWAEQASEVPELLDPHHFLGREAHCRKTAAMYDHMQKRGRNVVRGMEEADLDLPRGLLTSILHHPRSLPFHELILTRRREEVEELSVQNSFVKDGYISHANHPLCAFLSVRCFDSPSS